MNVVLALLSSLLACSAPVSERPDPDAVVQTAPPTGTMPPPKACDQITIYEALWSRPRLLRPLSTSRATTRTPTFAWSSCAGARVEVCADRDCAVVLSTTDTAAHEHTPAADLTGNGDVYFWRVTNQVNGQLGSGSPVWQVHVPDASAPSSTTGGSVLDLDLDGRADYAVGDIEAEGARGEASGVVHVYGTARGIQTLPTQTLTQPTPQDGALFGENLSSAGDVNGDGFADLIAGANNATDPSADPTGAAYVFFGGTGGFDPVPTELFGVPESAFGFAVSGAGDVDGDGYGDVIVGAPGEGATKAGAAYVYRGRPGSSPGLGTPHAALAGSGVAGSEFGVAVSGVGDLNGDGYGDVAVGESYFAFWVGNHPEGRVFVWYGSEDGIVGPGIEVLSPDSATSDGFGYTISEAGDVNGDGYHDLVVGSSGANGDDGAVYVWHGGPSGIDPAVPSVVLDPVQPQAAFFGHAVSAAGDLDGDGIDDLVIGETDANALAGRIHVIRSTAGAPVEVANPDPGADFFGGELVVVGDVDENGLADFLVGAAGTAHLFPSTGAAPVVGDAIPLGPASPTFGYVGN